MLLVPLGHPEEAEAVSCTVIMSLYQILSWNMSIKEVVSMKADKILCRDSEKTDR